VEGEDVVDDADARLVGPSDPLGGRPNPAVTINSVTIEES